MAETKIEVKLPKQDATQSIEIANFTKTSVASGDKVIIEKALSNKNNSLVIIVEPTAAGTLKILKGNNYPNAILGDMAVTVGTGVNAILLEDISRFENRDGSVVIDATFAGSIYAVAKRAGIRPIEA